MTRQLYRMHGRVVTCPTCRESVALVVLDGGRELAVSRREATIEGVEIEPGLYVAVDELGHGRPLRWPTDDRREGESLHLPHDLTHADL